jgi:hypothetical protein
MMVVELFHLNLPRDFVRRAVLNLDGQISAVVETTELGGCYRFLLGGTGSGSYLLRLSNRLVERGWVSTASLTTLQGGNSSSGSSDALLLDSCGERLGDWALFLGHVGGGEVTEG